MTKASPPAPSLKIRIRVDTAAPTDEAPATLDLGRVLLAALAALVLIIAATFGLRALLKSPRPEPVLASTELAARPPEITTPSPPALEVATASSTVTAHTRASPPNRANQVIRAVLADAVRKHQPVQEFSGDLPAAAVTKRVYFFTEVQNVATRRLTHRWEYRGKAVAQIAFFPGRKTWTGASNKQITPQMQGAWRVVLLDEHGTALSSVAFNYGQELTAAQN